MKLASLRSGGRDGTLIIVSTDLKTATLASAASTMQQALDDWETISPKLRIEASALKAGQAPEPFAFDESACAAPLPRAYQWADGSAYVNHVELVRKARGAEMPDSFWTDPLMYQGGSDILRGARDDVPVPDVTAGVDCEAEVAVITDDVPMGVTPKNAVNHIQLVMIVNDISLRNLIPGELGKGFGFFQSKPPTVFSPVAVTPNELGEAWDGTKINLPINVDLNGRPLGRANAGVDNTFDFSQLIAHAAKTRPLSAGSIIGSGTISNKSADGSPGRHIDQGGKGYSCIAEIRMIETIETGKPITPFMQFGDKVRIDMLDNDGRSIFGAIENKIVQHPTN